MALPIKTDYAAMEATSVAAIPDEAGWQYEPKWDGFRCLAYRDGDNVELRSKAGQPLGRYFPDILAAVRALQPQQFVLDGEIVIPDPASGALSFDALLQRIHPAESRVRKLAAATPGWLVVFDLLVNADGEPLVAASLAERRAALEAFAAANFGPDGTLRLSPATTELARAKKWFGSVGATLDGVVAKKLDAPYATGERHAMVKIKALRTADCVVGGFRYAEKAPVVGSLLLGLYDDNGVLHHVGFCSGLKAAERPALTKKLEALRGGPGFTGRAPGGPSRWSTKRSTEWQPLKSELVVEVQFDHVSGGRFRHGTTLLRWRPDKDPRQCTLEQLRQKSSRALALLGEGKTSPRSSPAKTSPIAKKRRSSAPARNGFAGRRARAPQAVKPRPKSSHRAAK